MSENQENSNQSSNQRTNQQQQPNPYQPYPYYYYPQTSQAYYPAYPTRQFPLPSQFPAQQQQQQPPTSQGQLPLQQSYIENILRLNRGKLATVHMTFEGGHQKTFKGIIEAAGRDHIILSEPATGRRVLLLMVYLDYITFDEEINYAYPFGSSPQLTTQPPR